MKIQCGSEGGRKNVDIKHMWGLSLNEVIMKNREYSLKYVRGQ